MAVRYVATFAIAASLIGSRALAQETPPDETTKALQAAAIKVPHAPGAAPLPIFPGLKPAAKIAHSLLDAGILIHGTLNDDFQGNPIGGLDHGTANAGTGTLGADLDLDKIVGLRGGQFHILFADTYGSTLQNHIGNYIKSQGWYYPFQHFELAQFAYDQDLLDGKVNIYAGRTNATAMFARPTYGCAFISGSQCPFYLPLFTGGFSGFPYVTWGGRLRVSPDKKFYAQAGVFSVDPNRRNVSGFNFSLNSATGVVVPFEIGYETDFSNDKYPRHFKLGGWYNNAPSIDPLLNANRQSRAIHPGAPLMNQFGRGGVYALADQVIYRPDNSRRNLAVFSSFSAPFDDREVFTSQAAVGALFTGPFASRPHDAAGLMLTQIIFSKPQLTYMNQLLAKNGSHTFVKRDEYTIEANYRFTLAPGVAVIPNVEYIIHPDITQRPDATFAPHDALVLGVRASINLGSMLGLPMALSR